MKENEITDPVAEYCLFLMRKNVVAAGRVPEAKKDLRTLVQFGIKIVYSALVIPSRSLMEIHYQKDESWLIRVGESTIDFRAKNGLSNVGLTPISVGQQILQSLIDYNADSLMDAYILYGPGACARGRELVGDIDVKGSMRHKYSDDLYYLASLEKRAVRNSFHCSGNGAEAIVEIKNFMKARLFPGFQFPF